MLGEIWVLLAGDEARPPLLYEVADTDHASRHPHMGILSLKRISPKVLQCRNSHLGWSFRFCKASGEQQTPLKRDLHDPFSTSRREQIASQLSTVT